MWIFSQLPDQPFALWCLVWAPQPAELTLCVIGFCVHCLGFLGPPSALWGLCALVSLPRPALCIAVLVCTGLVRGPSLWVAGALVLSHRLPSVSGLVCSSFGSSGPTLCAASCVHCPRFVSLLSTLACPLRHKGCALGRFVCHATLGYPGLPSVLLVLARLLSVP